MKATNPTSVTIDVVFSSVCHTLMQCTMPFLIKFTQTFFTWDSTWLMMIVMVSDSITSPFLWYAQFCFLKNLFSSPFVKDLADSVPRMASFGNDKRIIDKVRVVVHTTGPWPNGMSDNHWSIYLLLANDTSVRMNMRASLDDPTGHLEWTSLSYALTNSAISHWDYQAKAGITVGAIHRLIYQKRRDKYTMSGGGSGCCWWM